MTHVHRPRPRPRWPQLRPPARSQSGRGVQQSSPRHVAGLAALTLLIGLLRKSTMVTPIKRSIFGLVLCIGMVGAMASAPATPAAAAGGTFTGTYSGTYAYFCRGFVPIINCFVDITGTGSGTFIGESSVSAYGVAILRGCPEGLSGTMTSTSNPADSISMNLTLTSSCFSGKIKWFYRVTGGTGRFASAGGSGQVTGTHSSSTFNATWTGTLTY